VIIFLLGFKAAVSVVVVVAVVELKRTNSIEKHKRVNHLMMTRLS
jgi:hypothetical protein